MTGCFNCDQATRLDDLPPRDRIYIGDHWRVVHAWSALPGWLIIISRRHLLSLGELTAQEASDLGKLLRGATMALCSVVDCAKTYVVSYAEVSNFEHLHFHVIPRMSTLDPSFRGGGVFQLLKRPEAEWVPATERDRLALAIASDLEHALSQQ